MNSSPLQNLTVTLSEGQIFSTCLNRLPTHEQISEKEMQRKMDECMEEQAELLAQSYKQMNKSLLNN